MSLGAMARGMRSEAKGMIGRGLARVRRRPSSAAEAYGAAFYARVDAWTRHSARRCVPVFQQLLNPRSVIDVGCGLGYWLEEFRALGVQDILGLEGPHLGPAQAVIPEGRFRNQDLTLRFRLDRTFDLALCLEVAEHLPSRCAETLVESLTDLAPLIVFSAAIPGQGGVNHVNEQWPWYWQELFARHGYTRFDPFRKQFWGDPEIAPYYQQNIFLYVRERCDRDLVGRLSSTGGGELTLVAERVLKEMTRRRSPAASIMHRGRSLARAIRRILARGPRPG